MKKRRSKKERLGPEFRKNHGKDPLRLAPGKKRVCLCTKLLCPV